MLAKLRGGGVGEGGVPPPEDFFLFPSENHANLTMFWCYSRGTNTLALQCISKAALENKPHQRWANFRANGSFYLRQCGNMVQCIMHNFQNLNAQELQFRLFFGCPTQFLLPPSLECCRQNASDEKVMSPTDKKQNHEAILTLYHMGHSNRAIKKLLKQPAIHHLQCGLILQGDWPSCWPTSEQPAAVRASPRGHQGDTGENLPKPSLLHQ